jgi:hypothetical protein
VVLCLEGIDRRVKRVQVLVPQQRIRDEVVLAARIVIAITGPVPYVSATHREAEVGKEGGRRPHAQPVLIPMCVKLSLCVCLCVRACVPVVVASAREIEPFGVSELVSHKVQPRLARQRVRQQPAPPPPPHPHRVTRERGRETLTQTHTCMALTRVHVRAAPYRMSLCRAMPRWMTGVVGERMDMFVYISASISQKASVLSPTRAWSWLSVYATVRSCTNTEVDRGSETRRERERDRKTQDDMQARTQTLTHTCREKEKERGPRRR